MHSHCVANLFTELYQGVNMPESQQVQGQGQQTSKVGSLSETGWVSGWVSGWVGEWVGA